ncbi:Protein Y66D12A.10 [Aphelenchoides avenae]|nr:Protein Y66D12A.10 [Aphelenchus avenae]
MPASQNQAEAEDNACGADCDDDNIHEFTFELRIRPWTDTVNEIRYGDVEQNPRHLELLESLPHSLRRLLALVELEHPPQRGGGPEPPPAANAEDQYKDPQFQFMWITDARKEQLTYKEIFSRCCDKTVTKVVIEDRYVAQEAWQLKHLEDFCMMLADNTVDLKKIELRTDTEPCAELGELARKLEGYKISITHKYHRQHPRIYRFDNGWTVIGDRGLNIWNSMGGDDCSSSNSTYFIYFPPGVKLPETYQPMDEADEESEATPIAPIVNELSRPVVNLTRPTQEKEAEAVKPFLCVLWANKAHIKEVSKGNTKCAFYHAEKECVYYKRCEFVARVCPKAHPFCREDTYCKCNTNSLDPQLNHRFPPKGNKR